MDIKLIRRLIRLMHRADLQEIEVEEEGRRVKLRRAEPRGHAPAAAFAPIEARSAGSAPPRESAPAAAGLPEGVVEFRSPMVGTFYRAASPDAEPFVAKGSKIQPESVLCIVEAMKVMNEIKAETEGEVFDILVKNGEPVEFGQPLFLIKTR